MTKKEALELIPELKNTFSCEQINPHHVYNVGDHILKSVDNINDIENIAQKQGISLSLSPDDKNILLYTMLLHDIGKPNVKSVKNNIDTFFEHDALSSTLAAPILERLNIKNSDLIIKLIACHDRHELNSDKSIKNLLKFIGSENLDLFIAVKLCDIFAQSDFKRIDKINSLKNLILNAQKIIAKGKENQAISTLPVNGNDLIALGFKGPEIGKALKKLNAEFIKNPELTKNELLKML